MAKGYPLAGQQVQGLTVGSRIDNTDSISSTYYEDEYQVLRGIREVPMAHFHPSYQSGTIQFTDPSEERYTRQLADQIRQNKRIDPLIVVVDKEGPYILEGSHRIDALALLGVQRFPAVVVEVEGAQYPIATWTDPQAPHAPLSPSEQIKGKHTVGKKKAKVGALGTTPSRRPRVLVGCEFSGAVRDAFIAQGCDAVSCDLLPSETPGPHIIGNVLDHLDEGWDLGIFFPPCTHLAVSGARHFAKKQKEQEAALEFVRRLLAAPIPRICLENPVGVISSRLRPPTQIIQPYQFGHPESKTTCLWLKNLPLLSPTEVLSLPEKGYWENQTPSGQNKLGPSKDRWKLRSATYPGVTAAMAMQWSPLLFATPGRGPSFYKGQPALPRMGDTVGGKEDRRLRQEAQDPNTPPDRLRRLALEGVVEVLQNPALPLLNLEMPGFQQEVKRLVHRNAPGKSKRDLALTTRRKDPDALITKLVNDVFEVWWDDPYGISPHGISARLDTYLDMYENNGRNVEPLLYHLEGLEKQQVEHEWQDVFGGPLGGTSWQYIREAAKRRLAHELEWQLEKRKAG